MLWWAWPHLRRLWAAAGAVTLGLVVNYIYSLSSRQPLPDQQLVGDILTKYWQWMASGGAAPAHCLAREAAFGEHASEIAAELAYHYERCGNAELTLRYLELAGERAVARSAYREAERHCGDAIALLHTKPQSGERSKRELALQVARGFSADAYGQHR